LACPTENELLEYAEGRRKDLAAHVKGCASCTALLQQALSDPGLKPTASGPDALVGAKLGEYVVDERIGQGGMGIVYRGRQPVIGKTVAIKVLRPEIAAEDPTLVKRLLAEARAANAVGHHGIIDIFSFGETPNGQHYFIMEYLVGESLSDLLQSRGRLSQAEAITLLDGFLGALGSAHAAGVIHRDLKPSNLFLVHQPDGTRFVKILDFGLAKLSEPGGPNTAPGVAVGTPEYNAPEQLRADEVDARADLYSVGVIAFQMLTGKRPYSARESAEVVERVMTSPVPRVSSLQPRVLPAFDELVYRLMKKRAAERPASAEEVQRELAAIKRVVEAEGPEPAVTDPAMAATEVVSSLAKELGLPDDDDDDAPKKKKRRWPLVLAGALLVLALGGAGVWWALTQP